MKYNRTLYAVLISVSCLLTTSLKADEDFDARSYRSPEGKTLNYRIEMANTIKRVPIWVFHGGSDTVVKTKRSRDRVAALEKVNGNVRYTEYEGVGHNAWTRTYANEEVQKWLLSQKKSEQPPEPDK